MKLKKLGAMAITAATLAATVGCSGAVTTEDPSNTGDSSAAEESGGNSESLTIGFSNCSQDTPFFANMTPIIQDYAESLGGRGGSFERR
ncbi:MAG TPA: hypothetical protein H9722_11135 [Candidatus Mediterraneibacter pullistercoris]|nr:hypothetical protein [Candidatus Mediterraneibacter pullistercoris]